MRLLLTRAEEDAARTALRLEAMGHAVLVSPVIAHEATGAAWQGPVPDALIATSARAFTGMAPEAVARAGWCEVPLYLVGQRTAAAAAAHGFLGEVAVAEESSALLALLLALPASRFVYFAGKDRKSGIEDALAAGTGHELTLVETYRAKAADALLPDVAAALAAGEIEGVLHFSRRSAEIFLCLAGASAVRVRHYCLSPDVAAPLLAEGHAVKIATRPDEAAVLALVDG